MFDFLIGTEQYPYKAEYLQLIKPERIDDPKTYEGAVVFQFRYVRKSSSAIQEVNGLKAVKHGIFIATKDDLPFSKGDVIVVKNKTYQIATANAVENTVYEHSRIIFEHYSDMETEIELV